MPEPVQLASLLSAEVRQLLGHAQLRMPQRTQGRRFGFHRSARSGQGADFRDHRAYVPGDDLRRVDWRAAGRQERLVLRQTDSEDELRVTIVVDGSGSMNYGTGKEAKWHFVKELSAAVAAITQRQSDPLGFAIATDADVHLSQTPSSATTQRYLEFASTLDIAKPKGRVEWETLIAQSDRRSARQLWLVVSDFLDLSSQSEPDPDKAAESTLDQLSILQERGNQVSLVQVLHRDELAFPWTDVEVLKFRDLHGHRGDLEGVANEFRGDYLAKLNRYLDAFRDRCRQNSLSLHRLPTDRPLQNQLLPLLQAISSGTEYLAEESGSQ